MPEKLRSSFISKKPLAANLKTTFNVKGLSGL